MKVHVHKIKFDSMYGKIGFSPCHSVEAQKRTV